MSQHAVLLTCRPIQLLLCSALLLTSISQTRADTSQGLENAIAERDRGRGYRALAILEQLHRANPDSKRIRLETALVWVHLNQYDRASAILEDVLRDAQQLPTNVRVNAQLLLLKVRRLRRQRESVALSYGLKAGTSHHTTFDRTLIDASMGAYSTLFLSPVNLAGYPLMTRWVNRSELTLLHNPQSKDTSADLSLATALDARFAQFRLRPGAVYYVNETGAEPALNLVGGWRPGLGVTLSGDVEYRWGLDDRDSIHQRLKLGLFSERPFRLGLSYRLGSRRLDSQWLDSQHAGASVTYQGTQRWKLGSEWALEQSHSGATDREIYLRGETPLTGGLKLTTDLSHLANAQRGDGWFARLGILWQP